MAQTFRDIASVVVDDGIMFEPLGTGVDHSPLGQRAALKPVPFGLAPRKANPSQPWWISYAWIGISPTR